MPFRTAIRWLHRLVTLVLLIVVTGFAWLNHQPAPLSDDELQRVYQVSDCVWLYMTVNHQGGATVPTIYRYYLSNKLEGKDTDIIQQLSTKSPVIEGTGTITNASPDKNGAVSISYSGKVISIQDNISDLRFTVAP
ncbi:TPA: hypothetical protein OT044_002472 [Citrobacter koseri]|uniref:hypothetical protein n=1 Tax=Citrobacter TaxID=544 RepID=UPI000D7D235E|nr:MULTISPECIES: hypothetical protein [Citrobacter]AYY73640.1 hypothetical protein EGX86_07065 [Citrobacter koseri]MBJ9173542.1 hypothetical protein [Citrobacter koseri]MCE5351373.1 hypothetical protein [Citrobacter koseri]MDM2992786.1 hypothetical protein [Citrobacter sp. CK190]MDM3024431.1 hypothetical protein [Citrobacter sp. CK194]